MNLKWGKKNVVTTLAHKTQLAPNTSTQHMKTLNLYKASHNDTK
jgi:hypothetical protein